MCDMQQPCLITST